MPKKQKSEVELLLKHLTGPAPDYKESELNNEGAGDLFEDGYEEQGGIVCRRRLAPNFVLYFGVMELANGVGRYKAPFKAVYRFGEIHDAKAC